MDEKNPLSRIEALISRLEAMAENRQRLVEENRKLRERHEQWLQERAFLISRNEQAKNRVEAMIARLKVLEEHT